MGDRAFGQCRLPGGLNAELRASKLRGRLRIHDADVGAGPLTSNPLAPPWTTALRARLRNPAGRGLRELLQAATGPACE